MRASVVFYRCNPSAAFARMGESAALSPSNHMRLKYLHGSEAENAIRALDPRRLQTIPPGVRERGISNQQSNKPINHQVVTAKHEPS